MSSEIPVGLDPRGVAIGFGSVWTALSGSNQVARIDPEANAVSRLINVGNAPGSLTVSADDVWVANTLDDTVHRVSPDTESVVDTIAVGDDPSEVAVVGDVVWVANEADGTLSRIEPGQPTASSSLIESVPQGMAGVGNDLWVSVRGYVDLSQGRHVERAGELHARLARSIERIRFRCLVYPASPWGRSLGVRTYRRRQRPARSGSGHVEAHPDGRWSQIHVRPPPGDPLLERRNRSGRRLPPSDRASLPSTSQTPVPSSKGSSAGVACHEVPRTCDLSRGIETEEGRDGTSITFNLVEPDPEFLYKLTTPFAYPIPPSVPDAEQRLAGVPGTGPYALEAPMSAEGLTLLRNERIPGMVAGGPARRIRGSDRVDVRGPY